MNNKTGLPKGHYRLVWASSKNKDKNVGNVLRNLNIKIMKGCDSSVREKSLGNRKTSFGQSER